MNASLGLQSRGALSVLLATFWTAPAEAEKPPTSSSDLKRAMKHYERCKWVEAFDELIPLADAGGAEAARIALMMRAHGSRLFGHHFVVGPHRMERWLDAASGTLAPTLATTHTSK
ncbi:MAG: hypothetical protein ABIN08_18275 [Caldimonas sp.]